MARTKTELNGEDRETGKRRLRRREKLPQMKLGQTIVAERERVESESERMRARKAQRRKRWAAVLAGVLMVGVLGVLGWVGVRQLLESSTEDGETGAGSEYQIQAEIVDEDNTGRISERVRSYIEQLERDVADLGYKVTRVTLPTGTSRELYVDLEGVEWFFKVTVDRDAAVTAEDMERMVRYLRERDLKPGYVDVRVAGKAFYK